MLETLGEFFKGIPSEIYVFIISVLPIVELRGAIPVGAALGLPFYLNLPLALIGNLLPVPFILLFIPRLLDFLARFKIFRPLVLRLRKKANKHSARVLGKDTAQEAPEVDEVTLLNSKESAKSIGMTRGVFLALFLFVAVPLPGTGAWTGSLVASLFNLPKRWSFLAILLGVIVAGIIMCLASYGVLGFLEFLT